MLKLPKGILAHPKAADIAARFSQKLHLLWPSGRLMVPRWELDSQMRMVLTGIAKNGHVVQGLEAAAKSLDRERHGLDLLVAKTGEQKSRLSRLILLSADGSERFYHDAESLLLKHPGRLMGCILEVSSEDFGQVLLPAEKNAKALMINDRKSLEQFLIAPFEN